jgi:hypothetical protein
MPARAERLPFQSSTEHAGLKPLIGWAALATIVAWIRRVMTEPSLPRMSEQWLLSHQTEFNRDHDGLYPDT